MAVTLLRHTRPLDAEGLCYGARDLDLAPGFETEAEAVLDVLPAVRVLISSPLRRCRLLAERIGAKRGCDVTLDPDWREMDFGTWEGLAWDAIPRAELDAWAADFMGYEGHGGESVTALQARVRRAVAATPDGALVVTHAGAIKAALAVRNLPDAWERRTPFGGMVVV